MLEGVGNVISGLFEGLDLRRWWLTLSGMTIVIALGLMFIEQQTGFVYYRSLEKKVALLKDLSTLSKDGNLAADPQLKQVYVTTLQEVNHRSIRPFNFLLTFSTTPSPSGKGYLALLLVFLSLY